MLARHGYGVLLFDRRGEGESEGDPNVFGWQGERDLHAAVAFLQSRPDVDPERIGGIGRSVGGEMLIGAAAESDAFKAIVSEGGSSRSVRDDVANYGWGLSQLPAYALSSVQTAATAVFTNNLPPEAMKASRRRSRRARRSSSTASTARAARRRLRTAASTPRRGSRRSSGRFRARSTSAGSPHSLRNTSGA